MNVQGAINDTMTMARDTSRPILHRDNFDSPDIGFNHVLEMYEKIKEHPMPRGKLNRWLAWIQCSVVSWGVATLEEMKDINRRHADTHTED